MGCRRRGSERLEEAGEPLHYSRLSNRGWDSRAPRDGARNGYGEPVPLRLAQESPPKALPAPLRWTPEPPEAAPSAWSGFPDGPTSPEGEPKACACGSERSGRWTGRSGRWGDSDGPGVRNSSRGRCLLKRGSTRRGPAPRRSPGDWRKAWWTPCRSLTRRSGQDYRATLRVTRRSRPARETLASLVEKKIKILPAPTNPLHRRRTRHRDHLRCRRGRWSLCTAPVRPRRTRSHSST